MSDTITFLGRDYAVADKLGLMPLIKFAYVANKGTEGSDMEGMAAMYTLLRSVIEDEQWPAFEEHATEARATDDDLMEAVQQAIGVMTARPTSRPSDSSDGPSSTETSSSDASLSLASSIPAPTNVSPLDARAARELRPVEVAALELIAN